MTVREQVGELKPSRTLSRSSACLPACLSSVAPGSLAGWLVGTASAALFVPVCARVDVACDVRAYAFSANFFTFTAVRDTECVERRPTEIGVEVSE